MGRPPKCKCCGKQLDVNTAYKVEGKNKNTYYCSKNEYESFIAKKANKQADKDKVNSLVCEIIERKAIVNTIYFSEKQLWNKVCSDEVIAQYLEENKDYLCSVVSRLEDKEFNRIRYLSAILKNNLGDYKPKKEEPIVKIAIDETIYDVSHIPTHNKRRSLSDLEDEI